MKKTEKNYYKKNNTYMKNKEVLRSYAELENKLK